MKKLFCSQYDDIQCCPTCHREDEFYKTTFKQFEISHCCSSFYDIKEDILKHLEEQPENDCI